VERVTAVIARMDRTCIIRMEIISVQSDFNGTVHGLAIL